MKTLIKNNSKEIEAKEQRKSNVGAGKFSVEISEMNNAHNLNILCVRCMSEIQIGHAVRNNFFSFVLVAVLLHCACLVCCVCVQHTDIELARICFICHRLYGQDNRECIQTKRF